MLPIPRLSHNLKIVRKDGETYDFADHGILVQSFIVDSPSPVHNRITNDGRDGFIDGGTTYDGRTLHATCMLWATDIPDFALFRDELFRALDSRDSFYLINDAEPGKRWNVKVDSKFSLMQKSIVGSFTIDFESDKPYAESVGRTDIDPIDMDSDMWQMVGGGIPLDDDPVYLQSTNSFKIWNGGDIAIDPRLHELIVDFVGASSGLTIKNLTTGEQFQYTGATSSSDKLELNKMTAYKSGANVLGDTSRTFISLAPGWNDIQLSGTSGVFKIIFGFRFLYL